MRFREGLEIALLILAGGTVSIIGIIIFVMSIDQLCHTC